jgi:hypothetical protein
MSAGVTPRRMFVTGADAGLGEPAVLRSRGWDD